MQKLMNWLMLSCKKATELIEKRSFIGLSRRENLRLLMHTSMCDACTNYQKQSLLIDKLLQQHISNISLSKGLEPESNALKNRILDNLPK